MNIDDLFKTHKIENNEVIKAFNHAVERAKGSEEEISSFILVTDKQVGVCGTGGELLSLIAVVINDLSKRGLTKEKVLETVEIAYMSDEELTKKTKETIKKFKKDVKKLKEILDDLGKDDDDE